MTDFWLGALSAYCTIATLALLGVAGFAAWARWWFRHGVNEASWLRKNGVAQADIVFDAPQKPKPQFLYLGEQKEPQEPSE